jgi:septal ring factor EnvC (AmiA/AmiB activator)
MARADAASAQRSLAAATMERDKLAIQLDGAAEDAERLQANIDKLRAERIELTRQLDAATAAAAEVAQQRRREQSTEATLKAEISSLKSELAGSQETLEIAKAAAAAAQVRDASQHQHSVYLRVLVTNKGISSSDCSWP